MVDRMGVLMHRFPFSGRTLGASVIAAFAGLVACATLTPIASADRVYHSQHLVLTPVGGAPLRSGFVENIKAEGPAVYAHELFVLNGASPFTTYTVVRNFFYLAPDCSGDAFAEEVTDLRTNAAGNARSDFVVRPAAVEGFEGLSGVYFAVTDQTGSVLYRTACSAVTLD